MKYKDGVKQYNKPVKSHMRNIWIADSWRYNGCYIQKNGKRIIFRKQKHKDNYDY